MPKKIIRCGKKTVEQGLGKKFIEDFTQESRSQLSMCEFKGEAAAILTFSMESN